MAVHRKPAPTAAHARTVRALIELKANPEALDSDRCNVHQLILAGAAAASEPDIVRDVLAATNVKQRINLRVSVYDNDFPIVASPFVYAVWKMRSVSDAFILTDETIAKQCAIVRLLADANADLSSCAPISQDRKTAGSQERIPLLHAALSRTPALVSCLLELGADPVV